MTQQGGHYPRYSLADEDEQRAYRAAVADVCASSGQSVDSVNNELSRRLNKVVDDMAEKAGMTREELLGHARAVISGEIQASIEGGHDGSGK